MTLITIMKIGGMKVGIAYDEIQKRHARRCEVIREFGKMRVPNIIDSKAVKEFKKIIGDKQNEVLDEIYMIDTDVQVLVLALNSMGSKGDAAVSQAWESCFNRMNLEEQASYFEYLNKSLDDEIKEAKKTGDVPGQRKMFKDDGSVAEEASAVKTTKLEAVK